MLALSRTTTWLLSVCGAIAVLFVLMATRASAAALDESVDGDFSGNRAAPTFFFDSAGVHTLAGSVGRARSVSDLDYLRFTVPVGHALTRIELVSYSGPAGIENASFGGLQAGSVMTVDPANPVAADLLGWGLFGNSADGVPIGGDLLAAMGASGLSSFQPAQGFVPPLGAGDYTLWLQEVSNTWRYGFEFTVARAAPPIPEPGTWAAVAVGLAALAGSTRRRRVRRLRDQRLAEVAPSPR